MMKQFKNVCAQGDLMIVRVDSVPRSAVCVDPAEGKYILAHSETGHHHVINASPAVIVRRDDNDLYLTVIEATDDCEVLLEHLRHFDTHEPVILSPGDYRIIRQREYVPNGWRRVED